MNKLKHKLKHVTAVTVQELYKSEVILPSLYFKTFDKNAKKEALSLNSPKFEKEVENIIIEDFKILDTYMKRTIENAEILMNAAVDAETAIIKKDNEALVEAQVTIKMMQKNMQQMQQQIYKDTLTQLNNKEWINYKFLSSDGSFQEDGVMVLIDLKDFKKINANFGDIVADNTIKYLSKFISNRVEEEAFECKITRYSGDRFLLFFNDDVDEVKNLMNDMRLALSGKTLQVGKTGKKINITFCFGIDSFKQNDKFHSILEFVDDSLKEDKFQVENGEFIN